MKKGKITVITEYGEYKHTFTIDKVDVESLEEIIIALKRAAYAISLSTKK